MRTVHEYREFAERCRDLAAKLANPRDKRALELMASVWDKVAKEREIAIKSKAPHEPPSGDGPFRPSDPR
jgi:hypothetical protein